MHEPKIESIFQLVMFMIGADDFTGILTYMSARSGVPGIVISLSGQGNPMTGGLFLLISGCCDFLDGRDARMKKNRTEEEKLVGSQINLLSDLIAYSIEPECIGSAVLKASVASLASSGFVADCLPHGRF